MSHIKPLGSMNWRISIGICGIVSLSCAAQEENDSHGAAEAIIEQWVKTEGLISKEASDWELKKQHFSQLKSVFEAQVNILNEELEATQFNESDFEKKVTGYKKSIEDSESARKATIKFVNTVAPRVTRLSELFPEPLQQKVSLDIEVLQEEAKNENVREQLNAIIKVLQSADQFNRRFNVNEQSLTFEGESYRANVIYLGLSSAFFKAGDKYGVGEPNAGEWSFRLTPEYKKQIEKGFAVYDKKVPSALFELPLKVKEVQP